MRFALIEDQAEERKRIDDMLSEFCRERMISFTTDVFTSGEEFLASFVPMNYDVVFMDIYGRNDGNRGCKTDAHTGLPFLSGLSHHQPGTHGGRLFHPRF